MWIKVRFNRLKMKSSRDVVHGNVFDVTHMDAREILTFIIMRCRNNGYHNALISVNGARISNPEEFIDVVEKLRNDGENVLITAGCIYI